MRSPRSSAPSWRPSSCCATRRAGGAGTGGCCGCRSRAPDPRRQRRAIRRHARDPHRERRAAARLASVGRGGAHQSSDARRRGRGGAARARGRGARSLARRGEAVPAARDPPDRERGGDRAAGHQPRAGGRSSGTRTGELDPRPHGPARAAPDPRDGDGGAVRGVGDPAADFRDEPIGALRQARGPGSRSVGNRAQYRPRNTPGSSMTRLSMFFRRASGFTLIEILVVIVILGILAALIVPRVMDRPDQARVVAARSDIAAIIGALKLYRLDNGAYPSSEQGLAALVSKPERGEIPRNWKAGGYLERLPVDPWGLEYQYLNPGIRGEVDVFSFGADRKSGGEGFDADIGSWQ